MSAVSVIRFQLDGEQLDLEGVDPGRPLLHVLRDRGIVAPKEGCAEGECGACALVLVDRDGTGAPRYRAVNSCLLPAGAAHGMELLTARGIARLGEGLHPVQRALIEHGGSQCGFCTPGFVASLFAEYHRPDRTRGERDPVALGGNLCRCTGYRPILDALASLPAPDPEAPDRRRLAEPAPAPPRVELAAEGVRFVQPDSVDGVLQALTRWPGARLLAGGTDVGVEVNLRGHRPAVLVSLQAVEALRRVERTEAGWHIGAAAPLSLLEEVLGGQVPMLAQLWPLFASRPIRNRATLGGNLATASPIGDGSVALLGLDARVRLVSAEGARTLPLDAFFVGYRRTALREGEFIEAVEIPEPLPTVQRFEKVAKRVLDDISTVAAGFGLWLDAQGRIERARLAYGGVAERPARALEAEEALRGERPSPALAERVAPLLHAAFEPLDDHRGSAAYRRAMVVRLLEKLFWELSGDGAAPASQGHPSAAKRGGR